VHYTLNVNKLPKSVGQHGMLHYVPALCAKITYTSMSASERWSKWNDTLGSCEVCSNTSEWDDILSY